MALKALQQWERRVSDTPLISKKESKYAFTLSYKFRSNWKRTLSLNALPLRYTKASLKNRL